MGNAAELGGVGRPRRARNAGGQQGPPRHVGSRAGSTARVGRIHRETLGTTVMEALRASILGGQFVSGERLVESSLAQEMGVSRGPLREALARLEKDGLVQSSPRRGTYVVQFTMQSVDEHYGLRRALETYAVGLLIASAQPSKDRVLEKQWDRIQRAARAGDSRAMALADLAFHDTLYQLTGNELLNRVWRDALAGKLRLLVNETSAVHLPFDQELRNHRAILDAILARNRSAARAEVQRHVDEAWARMRSVVAARESVGRAGDTTP